MQPNQLSDISHEICLDLTWQHYGRLHKDLSIKNASVHPSQLLKVLVGFD